ncbi:hypothetical protein AB0G79_13105 [Streptomyces sp. NPDC020807]|uniref:hypothetical protein n=1 Tax=Streptomyces sp. NPDC020807 TaxID=3155119 RepID=UPI00340ABF05
MRTSTACVGALAVVGTTLFATACQLEGKACTTAGADSGASVMWRPADFPSSARSRLCVGEECRDRASVPRGEPRAFLTVPLPEAKGPEKVTVSFRVTDPETGRTVFDRTVETTLVKVTPNGEGCDPTAWQAGFRADLERGLVKD